MKPGLLAACLAVSLAAGLLAWRAPPPRPPPMLHVATWNLEWLVSPDTARRARIGCRDAGRADLPCDVALGLARDSADLSRLAAHARALDADVVALQEVENAQVARRVFGGSYDYCITRGPGVQQVGFAVRRTLRHRCGPALQSLAGGGRGRAGMALTLLPADAPPIELLAVHLKSGCSRDALDSPTAACRLLALQARALGEWIDARARADAPFMVLGDFNRAGMPDPADPFWGLLDPALFVASTAALPFANCAFGAPYSEFIDHILVDRRLGPWLPAAPFEQLPYRTLDTVRYRLSDHCPISVSLKMQNAL